MFNKGQIRGSTLNLDFEVKRQPYVKIECDAHNFMHEYLFVADNPYYSVTGEDGAFNIAEIHYPATMVVDLTANDNSKHKTVSM